MESRIKRFFDTLSPGKKRIVMGVREIVLKSDSSVKEDIKWGNLTFVSNGNIAFIYTYKTVNYINFALFKATRLSDPRGLREGTGKSMRHLKIHNENEIQEKQIINWIREAVRINQDDKRNSNKNKSS